MANRPKVFAIILIHILLLLIFLLLIIFYAIIVGIDLSAVITRVGLGLRAAEPHAL
jgi:hypothetical protein